MKTIITIIAVVCCFQIAQSQTWVQTLSGISMWSLDEACWGDIFAGSSGLVKCIFKSTNAGAYWDTVLAGSPSNFLGLASDSTSHVFAANVGNGLMMSSTGGSSWINIPSSVFNSQNVNSVACGRTGVVFAGVTLGGIYRSTNGGLNFTNTALAGVTIVTIAVDRFNSNIIYAGGSSSAPPNNGFYRSTDGGLTFSGNLNPLNIWGIAQKSNGNLYTITTSSGHQFDKSTNGGLNWSTVSVLSGAMRGLCLDLFENIYSAGNGGVWKSTNDGVSFVNFGLTYSSNQIICSQNKILVAVSGTANGGVWIYTDSLVGISSKNPAPQKFALYQNYPNPFNPATKIRFDIPVNVKNQESKVKITVYDILGRQITVLFDRQCQPGSYEVDFKAENLPGGIYFYELAARDFAQTKKMIFVK